MIIVSKKSAWWFFSTSTAKGTPVPPPISIQDLCYSTLPFIMAYHITKTEDYFKEVETVIDFILDGPYRMNNSFSNALTADYQTQVPFEGKELNIVSILDFLNVLYIPALQVAPKGWVTEKRKICLQELIYFMIESFYGRGIFWNNPTNREDASAKHVDFGHTSKAYGILLDANHFFGTGACQR